MIDLKTIKLLIWDLDETLWEGTFSEGEVRMPEAHMQLLRDLTDAGIINSISSKNDFEPTKAYLQQLGVWDLFVFPSINWDSKGPQIKDKLERMALRPVNTLYLDDNPGNLGEAKHYLPDLQVGGPEVIADLMVQAAGLEKKDMAHKRLNQYKILEEKDTVSKSYSNSEDFLKDSQIQVDIHKDCLQQSQRIHELLMRSNQLNYTKKRISIEELESVLKNLAFDCGYVTVKDRFGDYGLVGFYAKNKDNNTLDHFLFSCRTLGMKVEQWVYAQIGFPELDVVGDVRNQLNKTECPAFINQENRKGLFETDSTVEKRIDSQQLRILLKGPCDLSHAQVYIKDAGLFDTEFTYVSNAEGRIIDAYNHSVHIEGLQTYSQADREQIVSDCLFVDPAMLEGGFFSKGYDVIFLSTLIESVYYIYRKKGTNIKVVFGGADLTDSSNWKGYCNGSLYTGGNKFTYDYLEEFSRKYECIGKTTPESYISFLKNCLLWLPKNTYLCLILGATKVFEGEEEWKAAHLSLNEAIKSFSADNAHIRYIEIDDCVKDITDFEGSLNHFSTRVYYQIAQAMVRLIQDVTGEQINTFSSRMAIVDDGILVIRNGLKRVLKEKGTIYQLLKKIYNKIYKER